MHNEVNGDVHGTVVQARDVYLQSRAPTALDGLPPVAAGFTGREADLTAVAEALSSPQPVVVSTGLAGVGKTTLAVKAAHDAVAAGQFPGGVLFVDLQGYSPGTRVEPLIALATFLGALGVVRVPESQPEREALYRSRLAQRRPTLVVLDNASSSEQVRPLLPPGDQHRVLVTSRHTLGDLQGARRLSLEVLPAGDSVAMLANLTRATDPADQRVASAPETAHEISELCGRLPLALGIVAALLSDDPGLPLADLVVLLEQARLTELSYHEDVAVRAAFDLSHDRLDPAEQRLFRLLSLNPGRQVSTGAAAALAGQPVRATQKLLAGLRRAHMIESGEPHGWFRFHDLLRLYAAEHCAADDEEVRHAACVRLIDYCVQAAGQAEQQRAERSNIVAVVQLAHGLGRYEEVLGMAFALGTFRFYGRRNSEEGFLTYELARDAAVRLGDGDSEAKALRGLGWIHREAGHDEAAYARFDQAAAASRELGDRAGEGRALHSLGTLARKKNDFSSAWTHYRRALTVYRDGGERVGEGQIRYDMGILADDESQPDLAVEHFHAGAEIFAEVGRLDLVGRVHKRLALIASDSGRQEEAQHHLNAAHAAYLAGGHEKWARQLWQQFRKALRGRRSRE
ncbi:ATP-binding protein [Lentzea californiensis]|uniref:ATP-binding protein n=1 Tax=Lentzea californiensis TaxID=438851 RepID=UPI002165278B|nr:tetratricopeptide repeat protein [Lentzea californiensis]MCR3749416.1 NB-ARC domain-containing protein [Lentzea californiensis]